MSNINSSVSQSQKRLQGKVAIITGGASGIGASVTQLFWDNGAKVVIADIQDILGEALANKLHQNVCYMHCDVSKEEDIINLVDTTVTKYGQLDIMYNNAGIMDRPFGGILDTPKSDLVRLLNINVVGSFLGAKHAARVMVPQRQGCILFTSSACTSIAGLSSHAYAVSKYGVWGLVRNLSAELGEYGIRVNCVSPYAVINTGISRDSINIGEAEIANMENWVSERGNLKGKILKAQDIANAALYLASDEANYIGRQTGNYSRGIGASAVVVIADVQDKFDKPLLISSTKMYVTYIVTCQNTDKWI